MSRQVNIDKLNIRLPRGWRGDPSQLARQIAGQLQKQAADLGDSERIDLNLSGNYFGAGRTVAEQLGMQLAARPRDARGRRGK